MTKLTEKRDREKEREVGVDGGRSKSEFLFGQSNQDYVCCYM